MLGRVSRPWQLFQGSGVPRQGQRRTPARDWGPAPAPTWTTAETQLLQPIDSGRKRYYAGTVLAYQAVGQLYPRGLGKLGVADDIEQALIMRIRAGHYPANTRLPSVRELARHYGVNKNTIARIYQSLEQKGYVRSVAGKGVYASEGRVERQPGARVEDALAADLARIVWRAKLMGLQAEQVRELANAAMQRVYGGDQVRLLFVECNSYDAENLGGQVREGVGVPVRLALLSDLEHDAEGTCQDVDMVVTTFYHLSAVQALVSAACGGLPVIGVHAPPEAAGLLRIARAPHGSRVLVVCTEPTTLNTLFNQVRTYNAGIKVETCLVGKCADMSAMMRQADFVVDTHTSHAAVQALQPSAPVVTITFAVDQQSLDFLRGKVEEVAGSRLTVARSMVEVEDGRMPTMSSLGTGSG